MYVEKLCENLSNGVCLLALSLTVSPIADTMAVTSVAAPEVNLGGMPKPPPPEAWTFREELARPQANPRSVIPEGRKPWLENRISRCFFGPIKRAPYFHDELMDEADQQGFLPVRRRRRLHRGQCRQYTWHVLHDVAGLAAAMGGTARAVERLERLFTAPETEGSRDITGKIGQYVHGNEPSHHAA